MMAPPVPDCTQLRAKAWQVRKVPVRLTSSTRCHASVVMSRAAWCGPMPAEFTRIVGAPRVAVARAISWATCSGSVTSTRTPRVTAGEAAASRPALSSTSGSRSARDHGDPATDECLRDGPAEPSGAARDHRDLAVEVGEHGAQANPNWGADFAAMGSVRRWAVRAAGQRRLHPVGQSHRSAAHRVGGGVPRRPGHAPRRARSVRIDPAGAERRQRGHLGGLRHRLPRAALPRAPAVAIRPQPRPRPHRDRRCRCCDPCGPCGCCGWSSCSALPGGWP